MERYISLEQFFQNKEKELAEFRRLWCKNHHINSRQFPAAMLPGVWDEHFALYLGGKIPNLDEKDLSQKAFDMNLSTVIL